MRNIQNIKHISLWTIIVLFSSWSASFAGNNSGADFSTWPDTGQSKCYNATAEIPCPAPGKLFYGQDAQYVGTTRSYTVLGGGTMVQDNVTGLIWEMKSNLDGTPDYSNPHEADNTYTWCNTDPNTNGGDQGTCGINDTADFINQLNSGSGFGGYNDWRIPTIKELLTLVGLGRISPAIDPIFAAATQSSNYWSSTTYVGDPSTAWRVDFYDGYNDAGFRFTRFYVRAVRR